MPRKTDGLIGSGFDKPHVDVNKESREQAIRGVLSQPLTLCLQLQLVRGALGSCRGCAERFPPAPSPRAPALMRSWCWSPGCSFSSSSSGSVGR